MKKINMDVPMTKRIWVWLYVGCAGIIAAGAALWLLGQKHEIKKLNKVTESIQEAEDEPYFDDED